MSLWSMLESTCAGQRPTIGRDPVAGVRQDPWRNLFTNVACSYQEKGADVYDLYGQRSTRVRPVVYFAVNPGVEANDRLAVSTRNQDGTRTTFNCIVQGQAEPVAQARLWEVEVERIRQPW